MKPITLADIRNLVEYEKIRKEFRTRIIELKKPRRIGVGPHMTFAFENRDTAIFQIQEMVRTERLVEDAAIEHEIEVYNQLVPGDHELSATLLIEITEQAMIRPVLDSLVGLAYNSIFLKVGDHEIATQFDEGQSEEDRISAVQYLKWKLSDEDVAAFRSPKSKVSLIARHKNYNYVTDLTPEEHQALLEDLAESV